MLQNVVIMTDSNGKNKIDSLINFKYNHHVHNRCTNRFNKDTVVIHEQTYSNCIIVVDNEGNNILKNRDEISVENTEENNIFTEILKQVQHEKQSTDIGDFLSKKRDSIQCKLKTATDYYNLKSYHKANDLYKEVLTIIETDIYPDEFMLDEFDLLAIRFAYALCKMAICKVEELKSAVDILVSLKTKYEDEFPTLSYYLARAYFLLENFQNAKDVLATIQNKLKHVEFLTELNWPGSNTRIIERTEKSLLKENIRLLLNECNVRRLPDIKCFFALCEIKSIFFDSPCFNGYVNVKCSNNCNFTYHRNCWKMKLKADSVKKPSYFLEKICATDSCGGFISEIHIYDEKLNLNTFIKPKISSSEKESKSNDKNIKINKCKIISDIKIEKKNVLVEDVVALPKNKKKPKLNLNAKEYVPLKNNNNNTSTIKTTLNCNAMEYISPSAVVNNSKLDQTEERQNLFDIDPNFNVSQSIINRSLLNLSNESESYVEDIPIINYSKADAVSVDYETEEYFKNKTSAKNKTLSLATNDTKPSETIENLKAEIKVLQSQLFESEEVFNNLLTQYDISQNKLQDALAKLENCKNCTEMQNQITKKNSDYSAASSLIKQLEEKNAKQNQELHELKVQLQLELVSKQSNADCEQKLIQENEKLRRQIEELISRLKIASQQHVNKIHPDNLQLRKLMFDQIGCIRHAYTAYFTMYENKSKHMLWELEDIKALSSAETLPTKQEVEENIMLWRKALDDSIKFHQMMNGFYDHLYRQFSNEQISGTPVPMCFPTFIIEPPNVILRHFKSLLIVNKRLEQELHQQMTIFYKMISTPYPDVFPQKEPTAEVLDFLANETKKHNSNADTVAAVPKSPELVDNDSNKSASLDSNWEAEATVQNVPNIIDMSNGSRTPLGPAPKNVPKSSLIPEIPTDKEVNNSKVVYTGTIPKNVTTQYSEQTKNESSVKPKPDVVGQESLIMKLQQKLPLVSADLISKAVHIMREKHGGLTGKNSKQILKEIKDTLKKIAATEKSLRKSKETLAEIQVQTAWKKVNNTGVLWSNENPDVNCTICFEYMAVNKRVTLRCQHIFHTTCIKLWLQNDSICPICRSFATLDEEYPPLK